MDTRIYEIATDYGIYEAGIWDGEDGWLVVNCKQLPGCITQGENLEEALANTKEAMECFIESLLQYGDPVPPPIRAIGKSK